MRALIDSFWRAAAYCLNPRVIALSLLPLAVIGVLAAVLGWFFWTPALNGLRALLDSSMLLRMLTGWVGALGGIDLNAVLAPLILVLLSLPLVVIVSLLLVAGFMTPAMLRLVASRRFALLARKRGGSFAGSLLGAVGATAVAVLAMLLSIPLWFVPPLVLIVPPLIWGWLAYRVMSYDVLAEHASVVERRTLMREQRVPLFAIGVLTGLLGAAPSLLWASGALVIAWAPLLIPVSVWLYTLVFAFSALWFAHFALAELEALRARGAVIPTAPVL